MRILQVTGIDIRIVGEGDAAQSIITGLGLASTPGWSNVRLETIENNLPPDGILDLEFKGDPPGGLVSQVITPVVANFVQTTDVARLAGVRIVARINEMSRLLSPQFAQAAQAATSIPGGMAEVDAFNPSLRAPSSIVAPLAFSIFPGFEEGPTTLALFEEQPTTFATFEEHPKTLFHPAEEQKPFFGETDPRIEQLPTGLAQQQQAFGHRNPFGSR